MHLSLLLLTRTRLCMSKTGVQIKKTYILMATAIISTSGLTRVFHSYKYVKRALKYIKFARQNCVEPNLKRKHPLGDKSVGKTFPFSPKQTYVFLNIWVWMVFIASTSCVDLSRDFRFIRKECRQSGETPCQPATWPKCLSRSRLASFSIHISQIS